MFRVLRKDKTWNTLNRVKRELNQFPRGGGALLLFVPPFTRSTWRKSAKRYEPRRPEGGEANFVDLIELAESLGFVF